MAPVKKSKSINKAFAVSSVRDRDVSPAKDDKSNKHKKRKLSDMLGIEWSKDELQRFYEAYRKYGLNWKKVATFVRSRSVEMVEALYNMNRAYLSCPDGMVTVTGFIAMMKDHYNVMGASGSEKDGDEPMAVARNIRKPVKSKGHVDLHRDDSFRQPLNSSSDGCLSLLKMHSDVIQPSFPVKKRTPRVPVSCLDTHSNKKARVSVMNANSSRLPQGAVLSSEAGQDLNSPCVTASPRRLIEGSKPSPVSLRENALSQSPKVMPKHKGAAMDAKSADSSLWSNEANLKDLGRESLDSDKSAFGEYKRGKKKGKTGKVETVEKRLSENIIVEKRLSENSQEALNITGRGKEGSIVFKDVDEKIHKSSSEVEGRGNEKQLFEDERVACDALQTLAEMSSMMPFLAAEPADTAVECATDRNGVVNEDVCSDSASKRASAKRQYKRKQKSEVMKVQKTILSHNDSRNLNENETSSDGVMSGNSFGCISPESKRLKPSVRSPELSSGKDRQVGSAEVASSGSQLQPTSKGANIIRRKRNRKRDRTLLQKNGNFGTNSYPRESSLLPLGSLQCAKEISHCLSSSDVRRWCVYEWFYSAIDYPWFAKREFLEYLNHAQLGHITTLSRVEWGVIRCSLGKPRRFSKRFLQEEREKLKRYRDSVRTYYANLRAGFGDGLPTDLARPLSVGQQVAAIHPRTREVHNGNVLTVDRQNCLIQFNRSELGVEVVMDIDCMPLNPVENMPEALRRQKLFDYRSSLAPNVNGGLFFGSEGHMQNLRITPFSPPIAFETKIEPACKVLNTRLTVNGVLGMSLPNHSHSSTLSLMQPSRVNMQPSPMPPASLNRKAVDQLGMCSRSLPCWPLPVGKSTALNGSAHSSRDCIFNCPEASANVSRILEESRDKAQIMVDIAVKAISSIEEGEDAYRQIGEALDTTNKAECATNCRVSTLMPPKMDHISLPHPQLVAPSNSETDIAGGASYIKPVNDSVPSDLQVPSDLIASCVASLLMIQTCTERQYPPAEVAQILDKAVTSLHPSCSQNLSVYREIQMCMGRIKTQILALVPT